MPENTHASLNHHNAAFIARLAAEKYKPRTMKTYRVLLNRLVSLIAPAGISQAAITMEQPADLARGDERKRREYNKYPNITGRFLAHLIDSSVAAAPIATPEQIARELLRVDYEGYLARQRGLSFPHFFLTAAVDQNTPFSGKARMSAFAKTRRSANVDPPRSNAPSPGRSTSRGTIPEAVVRSF